jgi:uncharacterized membrane protein YgaE (UPF0421/DUF939 family)
VSYVTAGAVGLHEGYWAAISAVVVLQSDLQGTQTSARDRFIGTGVGALIGYLCALLWQGHAWVYALAVGVTVFLCTLGKLGNAGRLAAVAVSVIVLIPRDEAIWRIALLRFLEVSWGILIALAVAAVGAGIVRRATRR